jgi:16S rRNA (guanine966-N2)-methyltransferase
VREALFSTIESWSGSLSGLRFLDLYAGSGAVGLEAWSRGAGVVTLVEQDRGATKLIRDNSRSIGFTSVNVVAGSVTTILRRPPAAPYDLAFLDPPYTQGTETVDADLHALCEHAWLVPGALVAVERSSRSAAPTFPSAFDQVREKRYGETTLWYGHAASSRDAAPALD